MKIYHLSRTALCLFAAALGVTVHGITYDPAADFSASNNPSGVWSYGNSLTLGGPLVLHTDTIHREGLDYWLQTFSLYSTHTPTVFHNPTSGTIITEPGGSVTIGPGGLSLHPGPNNEISILRFTAPKSGNYRVTGSFFGLDSRGTTTDVHLLADGSSKFDGLVNGCGPGTGPSFDTTVPLNAGEPLDFAVGQGNNNSYLYDSTGLSALVTSVKANPNEYDLTEDFSGYQNPNGVWSYGWSERRGSAFQFDIRFEEFTWGHTVGWSDSSDGLNVLPAVDMALTEIHHPTVYFPVGSVNSHPGPNGRNSVIRWTAPEEGFYQIDGWFTGNDFVYPTTTDVAVLHNSIPIFTGAINSYQVPLTYSLVEDVSAGETIDFTVGDGADGSFFGDSTGLNATLRKLTVPVGDRLLGDFNFNGCVDSNDLAVLMTWIRAGSTRLAYDLNGDGKVDIADARFLVLHFTNPGGLPCQ